MTRNCSVSPLFFSSLRTWGWSRSSQQSFDYKKWRWLNCCLSQWARSDGVISVINIQSVSNDQQWTVTSRSSVSQDCRTHGDGMLLSLDGRQSYSFSLRRRERHAKEASGEDDGWHFWWKRRRSSSFDSTSMIASLSPQKRNPTNSAVQSHTWSDEYLLHKSRDRWWNCIQMCKRKLYTKWTQRHWANGMERELAAVSQRDECGCCSLVEVWSSYDDD